jgi:predicted Zn-dependent protease
LLKYSESYEAVIGVMAHEIGHINKFHISKRKDLGKNLKNLNTLGNISLLAAALVGNSDFIFGSIATNQINIQNYYQSFSRDQEREADYFAVEILNKLKLSKQPLINFLNLLEKKSLQKGIEEHYYKFSSHPIYKERYEIIRYSDINSEEVYNRLLDMRFNSIKAKLFGFTEDKEEIIDQYLKNDFHKYAKSILLSKKGRLKESMEILNTLIRKDKNNKFLLETKADLLFSNGFIKQSLLFYEKIYKINKKNHYINKKIFDIKFITTDITNKEISKKLFNDFLYLNEIFLENIDLNNKYKRLSKINDNEIWFNYFSLTDKFYKKEIKNDEFIMEIKKLKNNINDVELLKILNLKINKFNANI